MTFNIIIGNPPYQNNLKNKGVNGSSSSQLYPYFTMNTIKIKPNMMSLIIPARWFTAHGQDGSLKKLRQFIKQIGGIKEMIYYKNEKDMFDGVIIKGGVCYFLYELNYQGQTFINNSKQSIPLYCDDIIIPNIVNRKILNKVFGNSLIDIVSTKDVFNIYGKKQWIEENTNKQSGKYTVLCRGGQMRYIDQVVKGKQSIDKYKVFISKSSGSPQSSRTVIGIPYIGKPSWVCTYSFLKVGDCDTQQQAVNLSKYLQTKFVKFLISIMKMSQNVCRLVYRFVPVQDFTNKSDIEWNKPIKEIDNQLYEKYNLSQQQIKYIQKNIKYHHKTNIT